MGGLNETVMEPEPLLSLPMGPVRTLGDNRVGWIPKCEDAAPPRCAPVCKPTCCAFCAFRYFNSARAFGGTCWACSAFSACYLGCARCARCALYAFSKPYVQHSWPQKHASGEKRTNGRHRNMRNYYAISPARCFLGKGCSSVGGMWYSFEISKKTGFRKGVG